MSFGASHLIRGLAALSLPESDPNDSPPPEDRVFLSPPGEANSTLAWVAESDGASSAVAEVWVETDGKWRRAGASIAVNDPSLSSDVSVPNDARLFARVLAATASAGSALAFGFRRSAPPTFAGLVAAGLVVTGPPLVGDPGFPVYVIGSVSVGIEGLSTVNAALGPTAPGLPVRLEIESRIPELELGRTPVILGTGGDFGQPLGTETAPLAVRGSDGTSFQQLALEHTRADDPHAVRVSDGVDFIAPATEGKQDAGNASLSSIASSSLDILAQLTLGVTATLANQGTPASLAGRWPVVVTDGTNTMPTADVAARSQWVRLSNGSAAIATQAEPAIVDASTPTRTATGAPAPAATGTILATPGRVWSVAPSYVGSNNGTFFQLHDAAGVISTATMIPGLSFPLDKVTTAFVLSFDKPLSISAACKWGMSSTQQTYTASAETAVVFFQTQA